MKPQSTYLLLFSAACSAFTLPSQVVTSRNDPEASQRRITTLKSSPVESATSEVTDDADITADLLEIPLTYNEMVVQCARAISAAAKKGYSRQIIRILLPRDASNDQLGQMYELDAETNNRASSEEMKLVPTDESWQGGIMQLYRAASPTTTDILRRLSPTMKSTGVPPKIFEDRSIDESGVDGVGLLYTQTGSPDETTGSEESNGFGPFGNAIKLPSLSGGDMLAFVQPTQEVVDIIENLSRESKDALITLINPQWRNVDDALDSASQNSGLFGAFAAYLGGKGSVIRRLEEEGYTNTYTLEGYVCKGGNVRLLKRFDSDWYVFAENDSGDQFVSLGSMTTRPNYQDVEQMLNDKGVGYKYARDLGMAPKL